MMNPETGFANKRAADAVTPDFISRYRSDFDKSIDELANSLPGNQAQEMFRRRARMAKAEFDDNLMRHVSRETDQYRNNVYKGSLATEVNNAATNWNDPVKINDSIGRIVSNTAMWADQNGITGDALMAEQMENLTALHNTVVQAALDAGDVKFAADYLEKNKDQIKGPKILDLQDKIKKEESNVSAMKIADDVIGSFGGRIPTETEVRQAVRERAGDNPELRSDATQEALAQLGSRQRDKQRQEDDLLGNVYRRLEANGGNYMALPASVRASIPGDKIGTVRNFADSVRGGKKVETDWDTYYKLRTDPALLAQTNLIALRPMLDEPEFKELAALQAKAGESPDATRTETQTIKQRMDMRLAEMGIDPTPKQGTNAAKRVAKAWSTLDANILEKEISLGRKLTPDERNTEIDRLFSNAEVRGRLFGTNAVAMFELEPGQEIVTIEVPAFDRRQIENALRSSKIPVTEENIQYYYKKAQGLVK
jgi:hypothetical protein